MAYASTKEAEAGESKFETSLGCTVRTHSLKSKSKPFQSTFNGGANTGSGI